LGTRPYWLARRTELKAMIKDLHCPHLFVTFSAADVQWPDLHRHMPSQLPLNATEQDRARIYNRDLNDNPAIAAYWFQKRWELYLKHVLKPKFKITDYWYRYEWQHRGSSHVHAFFWLRDAPNVEDLDPEDPESAQAFVTFWDPLVSTINPSINEPKTAIHPSAQHPSTLTYTQRALAQLLNRVQRHTKCTSYCLRRAKGTPPDAPPICRFKYPKELSDITALIRDEKGILRLTTKRNDPLLNEHSVLQILGWRANVDFTPCASLGAVETYITKYCSKTEVKSESYGHIFNKVMAQLNEADPAHVAFQKLLGKLLIERDWSAQECMHILLGCNMFGSTRQFRSLNISSKRTNMVLSPEDRGDDDSHVTTATWIDRYEDYCRAKLQLHHPYRNVNDLQKDEDGNDIGWIAAYERCKDECDFHDEDPLMKEEDMESDEQEIQDEFEDEDEIEEERLLRDWQELARRGPRTQSTRSRLGQRDIDKNFDWKASYNVYGMDNVKTAESYIDEQKRQTEIFNEEIPDVDITKLVGNQRRVFLKVLSHYQQILAGTNPPPLTINIDGTAGTGKSFLISAITKAITILAHERGHVSPIIRIAPTGNAAFNIHGTTIHQSLSLPKSGFPQLNNQQKGQLQKRW
jgi:ATP-dependent DNA helicase PIF1